MKRKTLIILMAILCSAAVAFALGGSSSDPLISLSYLNGTYKNKIDLAVNSRLDESDKTITENVKKSGQSSSKTASVWTDVRLKQSDVLSGSTGLNAILLAGSAKVNFSSGAVVDVTSGSAVSSGASMTAGHRYLAAENAAVRFTVTSKTAVLDYQGTCQFSLSSAVDYNAMASALKTMHLFKGTYTGYGSGYDLEKSPTRLQALIMFIRVLGEEDSALAYTGGIPFTDVAAGSNGAKYVGYAYSRGYTTGYSKTLFKPSQTVNARQYTEFVLRALGYSSVSNTDLSGTLDKAQACGVLTGGEAAMLRSGTFLRAQLVYISYYALDAAVSGSAGTLRDELISRGAFTASDSAKAKAMVTSDRIS